MIVSFKYGVVSVQTPAKLNLFLEVLARRDDGFHEIETLMAPVSLFDSLAFKPLTSSEIQLDCRWASQANASTLGELPASEDNIVWRAVNQFRDECAVTTGAEIRLTKRIPAAAGLGGASSDAAAALVAANIAWNVNWPISRLREFSARLGSDTPFFFGRSAAVCRGRGEQIEPLASPVRLHVVIVRPTEGLSTAAVYKHCRPPAEPKNAGPIANAMEIGAPHAIANGMMNRLEKPAAALSSRVSQIARAFTQAGVLGHQLSGSGTCYFGVCANARHARRIAARLRASACGLVFQAVTLAWLRDGVAKT